jgi:hypothetical protein
LGRTAYAFDRVNCRQRAKTWSGKRCLRSMPQRKFYGMPT